MRNMSRGPSAHRASLSILTCKSFHGWVFVIVCASPGGHKALPAHSTHHQTDGRRAAPAADRLHSAEGCKLEATDNRDDAGGVVIGSILERLLNGGGEKQHGQQGGAADTELQTDADAGAVLLSQLKALQVRSGVKVSMKKIRKWLLISSQILCSSRWRREPRNTCQRLVAGALEMKTPRNQTRPAKRFISQGCPLIPPRLRPACTSALFCVTCCTNGLRGPARAARHAAAHDA